MWSSRRVEGPTPALHTCITTAGGEAAQMGVNGGGEYTFSSLPLHCIHALPALLLTPSSLLSHSVCSHSFQAHAHAYTAVYLESALELGQVSPREVHSELLLIYLHMALEEEREGEARWVLC
jgi:hypothetical protein